jgi:nucleotide-binding universal stress UspA family protein
MLAQYHWGTAVEIVVLNVLSVVLHYGLTVYEKDPGLQETERANANQMLDRAVEQLHDATPRVSSRLVVGEHVAEEILSAADSMGADLIVVADHGHSRIQRFLLGSTSQSVLTHAACSVWIVREQVGASGGSS